MKKIFIADDDPDILEIVKMMLRIKGYEVQATADANDIFSGDKTNADVIILDLWMSGIDGRNICKKLKEREETKHIPVMFMSANSQLKEIAKEYNVDYIEKPFEMNFFLSKINALISLPPGF